MRLQDQMIDAVFGGRIKKRGDPLVAVRKTFVLPIAGHAAFIQKINVRHVSRQLFGGGRKPRVVETEPVGLSARQTDARTGQTRVIIGTRRRDIGAGLFILRTELPGGLRCMRVVKGRPALVERIVVESERERRLVRCIVNGGENRRGRIVFQRIA